MDKQKGAIIIAIIAALGAATGGALTIDFSTTITDIGQIGDINTIIQNQFGVDLDDFKEMCNKGEVPDEFKQLCDLVD